MSEYNLQVPLINRFYYRFLDQCNAAEFVRRVSAAYGIPTLHRLASMGNRHTRRGAVLALTMLGRAESVRIVGEALKDDDRGVRLIAEDGLPPMWHRMGSLEAQRSLQHVGRLAAAGQVERALGELDRLLETADVYGDAWYYRADLTARRGHHFEAVADGQTALQCVPNHFWAAMVIARSRFQLGDLPGSIASLQHVLTIHPHWEVARNQLRYLQRALREQTDC